MPFVVEELKQATESFRAAMLSVVSFSTVLTVVNATLVGYAANQRLAGLLLAGPVFPLAIVAAIVMVRRMITPLVYTIVALEHRVGGEAYDWGMTTYVGTTMSARYLERVLAIAHIPEREARLSAIRENPVPIVGTGRGIFRGLLVAVSLGQMAAAGLLWQGFGWRLF